MTQAALLSEHARIMNKYGLDSKEEKQFLEDHKDNTDLIELCQLAHTLKEALEIKKQRGWD